MNKIGHLQKQGETKRQRNVETKMLILLDLFSLSLPQAVRLVGITEKEVQEEEYVQHFSDRNICH